MSEKLVLGLAVDVGPFLFCLLTLWNRFKTVLEPFKTRSETPRVPERFQNGSRTVPEQFLNGSQKVLEQFRPQTAWDKTHPVGRP